MKTREEILKEQLERAISEAEKLRRENNWLKEIIIGLIKRAWDK